MNHRALILSLLSLSLIGGDTPQAPGYVIMTNQNPVNPPQMPQTNPQYPQNPPSSNGIGSSAAGGLLGILINAGKPNPPDINTLRKEQYEANFQEAMRTGNAHDVAQFYPEKFVDKNPVYGFPELQNVVTRPERGAFFSTPAPAPVATPEPVYTGIPYPLLVPDDMVIKAATAAVTPSPIPAIKEMLNGNGPGNGGAAGALAATAMAAEMAAATGATAGGVMAGGGMIIQGTGLWGSLFGSSLSSFPAGASYLACWAVANPVGAIIIGSGALAVGVGVGSYYAYQGLKGGNAIIQPSSNHKSNGTGGAPNPQDPKDPRDRKFNTVQRTEAMKEIKKNYRFDNQTNLYKLKDNGEAIKCTRTGKDVINVKWDGMHGDIEALNKNYKHMGSLDPKTFEMYKGPEITRQEL